MESLVKNIEKVFNNRFYGLFVIVFALIIHCIDIYSIYKNHKLLIILLELYCIFRFYKYGKI